LTKPLRALLLVPDGEPSELKMVYFDVFIERSNAME